MDEPGSVTVDAAAAKLGITRDAVRKLLQSGALNGRRRGHAWAIDRGDLERLARQRPSRGRPLSASVCWGVIAHWSRWELGEDAAARAARQRGAAWLATHDLARDAGALRRRAELEHFRAHTSALHRLTEAPHLLRSGTAAADLTALIGGDGAEVELYAPAGSRDGMIRQYGLLEGAGPLRVRWIDDGIWGWLTPFTRAGSRPVSQQLAAPRGAALLDCLEHDDARVRRVAREALQQ